MFRASSQRVSDASRPLPILAAPFSLLFAPSSHLRLLPFTAIFLITVPLLNRAIKTPRDLALGFAARIALGPPLNWVHAHSTDPQPFLQWAFSRTLFLFGILHAIALRLNLARDSWVAALIVNGSPPC